MTGLSALRTALFVTLSALVVAPAAWAQETADEEGPKVQTIQMIERGWFLEAEFGATGFLATLGDEAGDDRSYGAATQIAVFAGYDILPIFSLGLGVRGYGLGISGGVVGAGDGGASTAVQGDLFYLAPTLTARFAVLTTERNFLWVRGDVGLGLGLPGKIDGVDYGGIGPTASAFIGYERFTKLRHFSFGASLGATILTAPRLGVGISFMPHVKYTF